MTVAGIPNSAKVFMIMPAVWLIVRSSERVACSASRMLSGGRPGSRAGGLADRVEVGELDFRSGRNSRGSLTVVLAGAGLGSSGPLSLESAGTASAATRGGCSPAISASRPSTRANKPAPPAANRIIEATSTALPPAGPSVVCEHVSDPPTKAPAIEASIRSDERTASEN